MRYKTHLRYVALANRASGIFEIFEPVIPIFGLFGLFWHVVAFIICTYQLPQHYESISLRVIQMLMILPLVFYPRLKGRFARFFPGYYLCFILLDTPYFLFFMTLKNELSYLWTTVTLCSLPVLIILTSDLWFIGVLMFSAFLLACLTVLLQDGAIRYTHFDWSYVVVFMFSMSGSLVASCWLQFRHRAKIAFMKSLSGTIAHEMKEPLNAITLAIDAMKALLPEQGEKEKNSGTATIPVESLAGFRYIIEQETETIRRSNMIIDSILGSLNGNDIDSSHFRCHEVGKVIPKAVEIYGYATPDDRQLVHLHLSHDFVFFGDSDLFSHCIFNLLNNALYYRSKPGFRIDISSSELELGNRIVIRDTGPGVPADKRELIFSQFYTSGKSGGNGLGLAFTRRVAASFGGSITCDSTPGEWTEFIIDLPALDSAKVAQIKKEMLADKQLLIVDDQAPNRILLSRLLSEMNCHTDQASNGKMAVDMAMKKRYNLILMDIDMPVLNGDEATMQLRTGLGLEPSLAHYYHEIPIIGITALPEAEARERSIQSGMDGYVLKPLGKAQLREIVDRCFFQEKPARELIPLNAHRGASILLVEDNLMTREFIRVLLERMGYRVMQAEDGRQALERLHDRPADLVIMDMEMPVMDGIETARTIRCSQNSQIRDIPIIMLSGHTEQEPIQGLMQSGIDIHLNKPIRKHELVNAISRLLIHYRYQPHTALLSPSDADVLIEKTPLLDLSILEGLLDLGDPMLPEKFFRMFEVDARKLIDDLDGALRANDHEKARRACHTLKGAAANIGAARIRELATSLNDQLSSEASPDVRVWPELLRSTQSMTTDAFSDFLKHRTF
jgi:two-component system, CAI-1 autoinducer sensor kinase/phosphatase CqsS